MDINNLVKKKLKKLEESKEYEITQIEPDNYIKLLIKIKPIAGFHKNKTYFLELHNVYKLNNSEYYFPKNPPLVKFISKIFHSNIYGNGDICLDILKDKWTPTYNYDSIIISIINLLDNPNPLSATNNVAANLEKICNLEFNKQIKNIHNEEERDKIRMEIFNPYIFEINKNDDYNNTLIEKFSCYFQK